MEKDLNSGKTLNSIQDIELVQATLNNVSKAFEKLVRKYRKTVYYLILKMVHNPDDADDLTQDAFTKAFTSLYSYDETYAFSTWLFRIATNNTIDFIRKKRVYTVPIESAFDNNEDGNSNSLDVADPNLDPNEIMLSQQRKEYLKIAIHKIPEKFQYLVELRYFQELSYEEIAVKLQLPLGTVKAQLFRARTLLTDEIGGFEDSI